MLPNQGGGVCPIPSCGQVCCMAACDQCPVMCQVWKVQFSDFYIFTPVNLAWESGCVFSNACYQECGLCSDGTARAWYVRDLSCKSPISNGVLVPDGFCSWGNCCPEVTSGE